MPWRWGKLAEEAILAAVRSAGGRIAPRGSNFFRDRRCTTGQENRSAQHSSGHVPLPNFAMAASGGFTYFNHRIAE
jgi:hypothetical protein